ncbi:hypothetical protein KJ980_03080 [Patescibacteria group bacterium]|nr:hypothetical protein [Patescibacteria group bacterium]MBU4016015.1 hypothetical protein [Patescibacteria group bacterium]MBU4098609.1 hypothetical protein [Patescibacteria group bacterium]
MNKDAIKAAIETIIIQIEVDYQRSQGMILTEDDLMSIIFQMLSNNYPELANPKPTEDECILAPMLHTELSWYDKHGKLTIKPDITILDPKYLSILHKNGEKVDLPRKEYSFRGDAILMELKFIRSRKGITNATINGSLKRDIEKIKRLFLRLEEQGAPYDLFCYFVVFNKTDIKCPEFDEFLRLTNNEAVGRYKMLYASGRVEFS